MGRLIPYNTYRSMIRRGTAFARRITRFMHLPIFSLAEKTKQRVNECDCKSKISPRVLWKPVMLYRRQNGLADVFATRVGVCEI